MIVNVALILIGLGMVLGFSAVVVGVREVRSRSGSMVGSGLAIASATLNAFGGVMLLLMYA